MASPLLLDFEAGGRRLDASIEQLPCLDDSPRPAISTCRISSAADAIGIARTRQDIRDRNRPRENAARSAAVAPPIARSASASPIAGECLKPWPEHGETMITRFESGCVSMTNPKSGVTV